VQLQLYIPALAFLAAFIITYFSIPAIIRLSLVKRLYDQPDERKKHNARISPLGGMAIFGGMIISFVFFTAHLANPALNSVLVALFILFITGVKDDLYPLTPYKKLIGQLLAVSIVVFQGDIRFESLYGLFEIHLLPYWVSVGLTYIFFLGIINSFNFIDGINGLSSALGIVMSTTYAIWFYYLGEDLFLILALSIAGSQLAFLRYNLVNAKIFMGDSGSMILGFLAALLTIYYLQANERFSDAVLLHIDALVFAIAVLIIPVMDTARVVFIRVFLLKRSPFSADRNHIHHVLLDIGLKHTQATLILVTVNVFFIVFTYYLNNYVRASYLILTISLLAILLSQIPFIIKKRQKNLGTYKPYQSTA
jgi:UDP-N-acetylmuramyl pentapeptide phosphotransferase/UDP-N-acetylglucosamine-1-phosphate transferase